MKRSNGFLSLSGLGRVGLSLLTAVLLLTALLMPTVVGAQGTPPPPQNIIIAGKTETSITLRWDAPDIPVLAYGYQYRGGNSDWSVWGYIWAPAGGVTINGLSANTLYEIRVHTLVNGSEEGSFATVTATTTAPGTATATPAPATATPTPATATATPTPATATATPTPAPPTATPTPATATATPAPLPLPAAPARLTAVVGDGSIALSWDAPVGGGAVSGYQILRRAPATEGSLTALVNNTGNTNTTYTDATGAANTKYIYRVKAVNAAGTGRMSNPVEITFVPTPLPAVPAGLSAKPNSIANIDGAGYSVTLSWDAPANGEAVTGYQILRREATATSSLSVLVDDTGNTNTTYTDATVAGDKKYIYRVRARNAAGLGAQSRPAQAKIAGYRVFTVCGYDACIKPIYDPSFLAANEVGNRMDADERVIGVSINGDSRAYSVPYLNGKEVVNDTVGGTPIIVTWCPNCLTTIVYERTIGGAVHDIGASGKLMRGGESLVGCLVLYDKQTRSLFSQVLGVGISGEHNGVELRPVPATLTTWGEWKKSHPNTKALERPRGYYFSMSVPVTAVASTRIGNKRIGYPFNRLSNVQNEEFNGTNMLLFYDSGSKTMLVFNRDLDDKTLSFQHDSGSGADTVLVDNQTGSKWKAFTGVAIEGELEGKQLEQIPSHQMYRTVWSSYYPNARVYAK